MGCRLAAADGPAAGGLKTWQRMRPNGEGTSSSLTAIRGYNSAALFGSSAGSRLLLPDITGADGLDHQVAQGDRRTHFGKELVQRCGGIGGIDPGDAGPVGKLIDERRRILRCILAHFRAHE
jgi:hypothetical protein